MKKSLVMICLTVCVLSLMGRSPLSYADSAEVLPKGVFRVDVTTTFYLPHDKRFDPDGNVENVAADFNTTLNSNVFSGLGQLETFFGLPSGFASLGRTDVAFELERTELEITPQYGLTDRLTVGVSLPYKWLKTRVKRARLDTSTATIGKSPSLDALVPLGLTPDTVPLTAEDIQQILGRGLDIAGDGDIEVPGFGFDRFETVSRNGIGDFKAGLRYQYLKTPNWRLAFTGVTSFPTGEVDSPDNLIDQRLGIGTYILFFNLNNDFTGIKNLLLNGTFKYYLYLPDKITKRVPNNVNQPITANKERVDRDAGDEFYFEVSGDYTLLKGLSVSALYEYAFGLKDKIDGKLGFAYESLEEESDWTSHIYILGLSYTTIPLFREKKFPFPLTISVNYRNRFAGSNNVSKSQFISFGLTGFF